MSTDPSTATGHTRPTGADTEVLGLDLHAATLPLPNGGAAAIAEPRGAAETARAGAPVPGVAEVDLTEDPFGDDLPAELAARAPKPWATRSTLALAGLVLVIGGFVAGAQVEKHFGTAGSGASSSAAARTGSRTGSFGTGTFGSGTFGNGTFGGGAFGGGSSGTGSSGTSTTGTVKLVDGSTIYVQTAAGQVLTVHTTSSTPVQVSGSLKDLAPGATVTVTGPTSSDGTVNATRISQGG